MMALLMEYGIVVQILSFLLFYLLPAVMIFLIAKKTNTSLPWLAFIPIAQFILILNIARKPLWWFIVLILLPILAGAIGSFALAFDPTGGILASVLAIILVAIPVIMGLFICLGIAAARGKSVIWGILLFIPCTSPIALIYLALSK
jgi:hypothetical protein